VALRAVQQEQLRVVLQRGLVVLMLLLLLLTGDRWET
jgi:hypothetical protein